MIDCPGHQPQADTTGDHADQHQRVGRVRVIPSAKMMNEKVARDAA